MKTGIELIAEERQEQINKHGFSLEADAEYYQKKELVEAAYFCLLHAGFHKEGNGLWPDGWGTYFMNKILNKTKIGQLKVAGAFLMAENDRRKDNFWNNYIITIAAEIDRLNAIEA